MKNKLKEIMYNILRDSFQVKMDLFVEFSEKYNIYNRFNEEQIKALNDAYFTYYLDLEVIESIIKELKELSYEEIIKKIIIEHYLYMFEILKEIKKDKKYFNEKDVKSLYKLLNKRINNLPKKYQKEKDFLLIKLSDI